MSDKTDVMSCGWAAYRIPVAKVSINPIRLLVERCNFHTIGKGMTRM